MADSTTGSTAERMDAHRPRVVVGIDGSAGARAALRTALLEAARRRARLDVVAVYPTVLVWTGGSPVDVPDITKVRHDTRERARGFVDEVRSELAVEDPRTAAGLDVHLQVSGGPPAQVLVDRAEGADLLVVGSRGRGQVRSALLGSVALHCVTHAPCPVTVVHGFPSTRPVQPPRVVVGVDGSETATAALREAIAQAGRLGAELDVVVAYSVADLWTDMYSPVLPLQETREAVRREIEQLVGRITAEQTPGGGPVPHVRVRQIEGLARQTLLDAAEGAAALVVGSRSRGAVRGMLLGSVALHCVVHAPCPVTVVHPEDRPAPVARSAEPATAGR